jgi:hypothetical protein
VTNRYVVDQMNEPASVFKDNNVVILFLQKMARDFIFCGRMRNEEDSRLFVPICSEIEQDELNGIEYSSTLVSIAKSYCSE